MTEATPTVRAGRTRIMGILNATPDSFSDGGYFLDPAAARQRSREIADEGADWIDVGAESTRPGARPVDAEEELRRLLPLLPGITRNLRVPVSVDTTKARVAEAALRAGATGINDIWGFQKDPELARVAAAHNATVFLMHNRETPLVDGDLVSDVLAFFERSVAIATAAGVSRERIFLDPGIGFGKTQEQNLLLLRRLPELVAAVDFPLLLGTSRKSLFGHLLDLPVHQRLEATLATTVAAAAAGCAMVRVHDVRANARAAAMADFLYRAPASGKT